MTDILQDLRYGLRLVGKQPLFSSIVIATFALGIGVNVAIFSAVKAVLFTPLAYDRPESVLQVWGSNDARDVQRWGVSLHDYEDWRAQSRTLSEIGVYNTRAANLATGEGAERVRYALVSPSLLALLGVPPATGRLFREEENLPGADDVVVLSHGFWQNALGGAGDVVGSTIRLDGRDLVVVGVMPQGFSFPGPSTQAWKPFGMRPDDSGDRGGRWVSAIGRLSDDSSLQQAQEEMSAIARALEEEYPESNSGFGVFLEKRLDFVVSNARSVLGVTWGIVGMILLIVCVNVANLMLARASARSKEMAIRSSIGAGRGRLVRQTLCESLIFATLGGIAGVVLAAASMGWLRSLENTGLPRLTEMRVDTGVLLYASAISLAAGLLFGIAPALRAARQELVGQLREGAATRGRRASREALVVTEIALAVIVLFGAGLLLRSFWQLQGVSLGFETENRLSARVTPSWSEIPDRDQAMITLAGVLDRIRATPGVRRVAMTNVLPLAGVNAWNTNVSVTGRPEPPTEDRQLSLYRTVSDGYFETIGMPIVQGRGIVADDRAEGPFVVAVSETFAERVWPDEEPLGQRIHFVPRDHPAFREFTVVGVVGDAQDNSLQTGPSSIVYLPLTQAGWGYFQDWGTSFVVEVDSVSTPQVEAVGAAIRDEAPSIPVHQVETLEHRFEGALAVSRFNMRLLTSFGALALLLASIGIYGVLTSMVGQRIHEIGMRMALGADSGRIVRMVVRRGILLTVAGVALGSVAALFTSRWLQSLVFETSTSDPATMIAAAAVLLLVALLACLVPARRATRVDPMVCLRRD